MKLRVAQSGLEDLHAIRSYYAAENAPHVGTKYVAEVLERAEMLTSHPDAGRVVPEFTLEHIRELIHSPFRIVYLRQANEIVIIRVWRSERLLELPED